MKHEIVLGLENVDILTTSKRFPKRVTTKDRNPIDHDSDSRECLREGCSGNALARAKTGSSIELTYGTRSSIDKAGACLDHALIEDEIGGGVNPPLFTYKEWAGFHVHPLRPELNDVDLRHLRRNGIRLRGSTSRSKLPLVSE